MNQFVPEVDAHLHYSSSAPDAFAAWRNGKRRIMLWRSDARPKTERRHGTANGRRPRSWALWGKALQPLKKKRFKEATLKHIKFSRSTAITSTIVHKTTITSSFRQSMQECMSAELSMNDYECKFTHKDKRALTAANSSCSLVSGSVNGAIPWTDFLSGSPSEMDLDLRKWKWHLWDQRTIHAWFHCCNILETDQSQWEIGTEANGTCKQLHQFSNDCQCNHFMSLVVASWRARRDS